MNAGPTALSRPAAKTAPHSAPKAAQAAAKVARRHLTPADYLQKILNARVYDVAIETELEQARHLSQRLDKVQGRIVDGHRAKQR